MTTESVERVHNPNPKGNGPIYPVEGRYPRVSIVSLPAPAQAAPLTTSTWQSTLCSPVTALPDKTVALEESLLSPSLVPSQRFTRLYGNSMSTISSALLCQTKGRGYSFHLGIQSLIDAASSAGDRPSPWLASSANHHSATVIHQP